MISTEYTRQAIAAMTNQLTEARAAGASTYLLDLLGETIDNLQGVVFCIVGDARQQAAEQAN